ncbi:MAG: cupin [Bacteroidia bacterium]|nr:cupin [Bacteroidia bacterium]
MEKYLRQQNPFVVPTTDGKLIEEHYGRASSGDAKLSVAHMVAPPGWSEPFQTPEFDEVTVIFRGKKQFELVGEIIVLGPGESILIRGGTRVRYSNPFGAPCEYWSFCVPAFSPETVHREE